MSKNSKWLAMMIVLAVIPLTGCGFMDKLEARKNVNYGVAAFTEMKYQNAAEYFEKAVELDPGLEDAWVYLGTSYYSQFVPGSVDPRSQQMANKAIETFKKIVDSAEDVSQANRNAMLSIASLYYQMKRYPEAKEWCDRILSIDPNNAEAYYRVAVMDYDYVSERTGLQGENVEFMTEEEQEEAKARIAEAITYVDNAISNRPNYFDAMEYKNLLLREKAKFEKDEKLRAEIIREADMVALESLELRLRAQAEDAKRPKKLGVSK
jgi:tetratricopeptide (TPR) repeat protein